MKVGVISQVAGTNCLNNSLWGKQTHRCGGYKHSSYIKLGAQKQTQLIKNVDEQFKLRNITEHDVIYRIFFEQKTGGYSRL